MPDARIGSPHLKRSAGIAACAALLGVFFVPSHSSLAQFAQSQQTPPTFRAGVDLVQIDVSVLDKTRRPVTGLKAADFTVKEEGVVQPIDVCNEFDLPAPDVEAAGWMSRVGSDVETNGGDSHRVVAIVLDDAVIPDDPFFIRQTKLIGREVVDRLGPSDTAAVIFSRDNRHAQSFTSDHAKLLAAVDSFTGGTSFLADPGADNHPLYVASERTVADVATSLSALPDLRKVMVLVSVGVEASQRAAVTMAHSGSQVRDAETANERQDRLKEALEQAQRANVTIYSFDPGGLDGIENYIRPKGALLNGRIVSPDVRTSNVGPGRLHDYMVTLAHNTGGEPTLFTNDPVPGINQMFAESGSYYVIGYRRVKPLRTGDYRRVDVQVQRKDVTVLSRHLTYKAPTAAEVAAKSGVAPPPAALTAIANVLPNAAVPLRATVIPFANPDGSGASLAVIVGVHERGSAAPTGETLTLLARAFTLDGAPRGERSTTTRVTPPTLSLSAAADAPAQVRFDLTTRLDVPQAGRYAVRLGVENKDLGVAGGVFTDVDVPDFSQALSLSGVALAFADAPAVASSTALAGLLPIMPTTERTFDAAMRVTAFLRIYQGGHSALAPVTIEITIRDKADAVVFEQPDTDDASRFGTARSADVRLNLPLGRLTPGPHLLTVDVTSEDHTVRREVSFTVR